MEYLKYFSVFVMISSSFVTSISITISKKRVLLDTVGKLTITCAVTEGDVHSITRILIRRLKSISSSGSLYNEWQSLASIGIRNGKNPKLDEDIEAHTKDYVAEGSWDHLTPANTYLTLSMNIEKLDCSDARYYRCELLYRTYGTWSQMQTYKNATFSAYVKPKITSLTVRKNGAIVKDLSTCDKIMAEVGDKLELTCTANIGSLPDTLIRWHRTSETSTTDEFISYQPPQGTFDAGSPTSDNRCGYTRVASIKYTLSSLDAHTDNNLAFECYVTVSGDPYGTSYTSESNPRIYIEVAKKDDSKSFSSIERKGVDVSLAFFVGIVISTLIVGILLGVALIQLCQCIKRMFKGHNTNGQHQQVPLQETEFSDSNMPRNTYEQLENRTRTNNSRDYNSLIDYHNLRV